MLARTPSPLVVEEIGLTDSQPHCIHVPFSSPISHVFPSPLEKPTCIPQGWSRAGQLWQVGISIGLASLWRCRKKIGSPVMSSVGDCSTSNVLGVRMKPDLDWGGGKRRRRVRTGCSGPPSLQTCLRTREHSKGAVKWGGGGGKPTHNSTTHGNVLPNQMNRLGAAGTAESEDGLMSPPHPSQLQTRWWGRRWGLQ